MRVFVPSADHLLDIVLSPGFVEEHYQAVAVVSLTEQKHKLSHRKGKCLAEAI